MFLDSNEVLKSNVIAVNPPLEMPLKEQLVDQYFAYITVNAEAPPPDMRLEGKTSCIRKKINVVVRLLSIYVNYRFDCSYSS